MTDFTRISKFLSLVLRHKPEVIGIQLDPQGWVPVEELLEKIHGSGQSLDISTLKEVVATNPKQRFAFNEDQTMIRANQGHSVKIDLGYEPKSPPEILFHGTATRFVDSIVKQGLVKGNRHHVHLSADLSTARKVGQRHGKLFVFEVAAGKMQAAGLTFFQTENGVWLTDAVPPEYLAPYQGSSS